jgi:hypothetical protein
VKAARIICLGMAVLLALPGSSRGRDAREQKRIDFLIDGLANLPGAVFIRNGTEYKAVDAQHHLRQKLDYVGERVKTAEDFIKSCASESSLSHRPYRIRLGDGRTVETATFFAEQLKEFDARSK